MERLARIINNIETNKTIILLTIQYKNNLKLWTTFLIVTF